MNLTRPTSYTNCCTHEEKTSGSLNVGSVNNLGAGFGKTADHKVQTVTFIPTTTEPTVVATVYYDDLQGLRHRGIKISQRKKKDGLPNPFPKDEGCKPPHGWRS